MAWFDDIFSSIGDLFSSGGGEAAGSGLEGFDVGGGAQFDGGGSAQSIDSAVQGIEAGGYDPGVSGYTGDMPWAFTGAGDSGGQNFGWFGDGGGYSGESMGGGALPSASMDPIAPPTTAGTGGATAGALVGPTGPEDVGFAPGMGPDGPTTPDNPGDVNNAVQYVSQQQAPQGPNPKGDFFDRAWNQVQNNPMAGLGVGAAAIGTGMQALRGPSGSEKELQKLIADARARGGNLADAGTAGVTAGAESASTQGDALLSPLTTGAALPAGAQARITANQRATEAAARSRAAASGTLNSTMTDSQIAQARDTALSDDFATRTGMATAGAGLKNQAAQQYQALLNAGVRELGGAQSGYGALLQNEIANDNALQEALAALSASLGRYGSNNGSTQNRYYR